MARNPQKLILALLIGAVPPGNVSASIRHERGQDHQVASLTRCGDGPRRSCVVDGDTFWYNGKKIRIADINTPEIREPKCAAEARLGARAAQRLAQLLGEGNFTLERIDRDTDRYGRLLRIVTRNGESIGEVLVREGLAERWKGYRGNWC